MNLSVRFDKYVMLCIQILVLCQLHGSADQSSFHASVTSHISDPARHDVACQVRTKLRPNLLLPTIGANLLPSHQLTWLSSVLQL